MKFFERLWNWLTSSAIRSNKKGHPDLYPLDVAKLKLELNLASEAKRLGEARVPAADAKNLTGTEASVVQLVEKARQDYMDWAVLRLQIISQDLAKCNVIQAVNRARQADKEFERKASALLSEQEGLLRNLGGLARKRSAERDAFKVQNGLTRDAQHRTPTGKFFGYAILVFLIVLEGFLNAGFFAQGVSTGLLGGFTYASILATLNIGIAFSVGKFPVRFINHKDVGFKFVGVLSLVMGFSFMILIGLGIAHLRDSLTSEMADPAVAALQSLFLRPLTLKDVFSWVLFFISIGFGTGALFDGLYSDDLYPGYGNLWARTQAAIEDYEDEISTLRSDLEEQKDSQLKDLDKEVKQSQASVAAFESLIVDKKAAGSRLSHALRDADNSLEALLQIFRTENELHRGDTPRPAYFDTKPELRPLPAPNFDTFTDETILSEQRSLVGLLLAEVQGLRGRIQESFNQQFDSLKTLEKHFSNGGVV